MLAICYTGSICFVVKLNYIAWSKDGKRLQLSVTRNLHHAWKFVSHTCIDEWSISVQLLKHGSSPKMSTGYGKDFCFIRESTIYIAALDRFGNGRHSSKSLAAIPMVKKRDMSYFYIRLFTRNNHNVQPPPIAVIMITNLLILFKLYAVIIINVTNGSLLQFTIFCGSWITELQESNEK